MTESLGGDRGDGQRAKARPGGRRARDRQAGVAAAGLALEQGLERRLPAGAQGRNSQRSKYLLTRVAGEVQQRVDLGDGHLLGAVGEFDDLVARLDLALLEHAEIEARAVMGDEQRGDPRVVHPQAYAVAGDARLRDLERRGADPIPVADADLVVAEPVDGEVLAELPMDEVVASELALPVAVGIDLVDEHGPLLAAVPGEVALAIAVDVEPADVARARHGFLEDAGEDGPALPGHVLGQADVDGQQGAHPAGAGPLWGCFGRSRAGHRRWSVARSAGC